MRENQKPEATAYSAVTLFKIHTSLSVVRASGAQWTALTKQGNSEASDAECRVAFLAHHFGTKFARSNLLLGSKR